MTVIAFALCVVLTYLSFGYGDYYDPLVDEEIFADLDTNTDIYRNISAIQKRKHPYSHH